MHRIVGAVERRPPPGASGFALTVVLAALLGAVAAPPAALAVEVAFPLTIDYAVLRAALRKHLGEETGGALELWRTPDGCGTFVVSDPVLEPADGRLRITGPASATAGLPLLGWCFASVTWTGHAEIVARPELGHDWQLRFRDIDFRLYNAERDSPRTWPRGSGPSSGTGARPSWRPSASISGPPSRRSGHSSGR